MLRNQDVEMFPSWLPAKRNNGVVKEQRRKLNIKAVIKDDPNVNSLLFRLKKSWLGTYCYLHLRKHPLARLLVRWLWANSWESCLKSIAYIYLLVARKTWRHIISQQRYSQTQGARVYKLAEAVTVKTPVPQTSPTSDRIYLTPPHDDYLFPEIYVSCLENMFVLGRSNLIMSRQGSICHDLYDFRRDSTSEELHLCAGISLRFNRICWLAQDRKPEHVAIAASFTDSCAFNYAHWLTEVLPRIALFCADERLKHVPLVIDSGLHDNIMESLSCVVDPGREIILIEPKRALVVDEFYMTSVAGYVPFGRRTNKLSGHSHGKFSSHGFDVIRERVRATQAISIDCSWPDKIIIRRAKGVRNVTNAREIENYLFNQGFAIVEPEKLTFLEQVKLFSNAKVIVGSSGAALANLIFAGKDTKIIVLMSQQQNNIYWYWQNMACASGNTVHYVLGELEKSPNLGIHSDFWIDLNSLALAIADANNQQDVVSRLAEHRAI